MEKAQPGYVSTPVVFVAANAARLAYQVLDLAAVAREGRHLDGTPAGGSAAESLAAVRLARPDTDTSGSAALIELARRELASALRLLGDGS